MTGLWEYNDDVLEDEEGPWTASQPEQEEVHEPPAKSNKSKQKAKTKRKGADTAAIKEMYQQASQDTADEDCINLVDDDDDDVLLEMPTTLGEHAAGPGPSSGQQEGSLRPSKVPRSEGINQHATHYAALGSQELQPQYNSGTLELLAKAKKQQEALDRLENDDDDDSQDAVAMISSRYTMSVLPMRSSMIQDTFTAVGASCRTQLVSLIEHEYAPLHSHGLAAQGAAAGTSAGAGSSDAVVGAGSPGAGSGAVPPALGTAAADPSKIRLICKWGEADTERLMIRILPTDPLSKLFEGFRSHPKVQELVARAKDVQFVFDDVLKPGDTAKDVDLEADCQIDVHFKH